MDQKLHGASQLNHAFNQARLGMGAAAAVVGAKLAEVNDKLDLRQMPAFAVWAKATLPGLQQDIRDRLAVAAQDPASRLTPALKGQVERAVHAVAQACYDTHCGVLSDNASGLRARLHEAFPWGVSDKAVRAFNAVRNEGQNLLDRTKGDAPSDAFRNADPRGKIFAQMCDTERSDSALHRAVARNVNTVAHAGLALALDQVRQGQSPDLSLALVSDQLHGHASDKDLRTVLDPRMILPDCPPLRKEATLSHFAASVIDQYMKPRPEICQEHADIMHTAVLNLRGKLQKLAEVQGPEGRPNAEFSRKVEDLFVDAARQVGKQTGSRHLGLDRNQASLVGMGMQSWISDVIQGPYNAGAGTALLGMLATAIPGGAAGADGRLGLGIARGVVGFAVGAASQAIAGQAVTHSVAGMRGLPAGLIGGNFNPLDKVVVKAMRQAIEDIQGKMTGAPLEQAYHDNVDRARYRMATAERWFGPADRPESQKAAQVFVQECAIPAHDTLCALKDKLSQRLADKASPLSAPAQEKAHAALDLLSGIQPSRGLSPVSPHEVLGQMMSLGEKTRAHTEDSPDKMIRQTFEALRKSLSPQDWMSVRHQIANPMPAPPVTDNMLDPGAMVQAVNRESPAFQKLMKDLSGSFGTAGKQDAFNNAISTLINTDLVVGIVGSALSTLMTAAASGALTAVGSPVAGAAGVAAGVAVGAGLSTAVNKGVRAITGMTTDLAMAAAATRNRVADASLLPRSQVTSGQIARSLETGWTPLSTLRDANLDKIVSRMSHDVQVKLAEESSRMGRNLIGSLFQAAGSTKGPELLAQYDRASAQYNHAEYKKTAYTPDKGRVDVAKERIGQVASLAGVDPEVASKAAARVDGLGLVKRLNQRLEKAAERSEQAGAQLPRLCNDLLREVDVSTHKLGSVHSMSQKEWNAMRAFLLYPNGHEEVRKMVGQVDQALKEFWATNGPPGASGDLTRGIIGRLPNAQAFQQAQARHERHLGQAANDVNALGWDVSNYRAGRYEAVQDPFGVFKRVSAGYESELRQLKVADVNTGYLEERVAGAVYGRGVLGGRLLGVAAGVTPLPANLSAISMPGLGTGARFNAALPLQTALQSVTSNPLAPFVESGDWSGRNPGGKARWLDTVKDVAQAYVDPAAQQAVNMAVTTKVRSASKDGVLSHDRAGLTGGVVGFPPEMARQVKADEASSPLVKKAKDFLNVPKHLTQSLDSIVANQIKPSQELAKSMASVEKINSAAAGLLPGKEGVSLPQIRTYRISDALNT